MKREQVVKTVLVLFMMLSCLVGNTAFVKAGSKMRNSGLSCEKQLVTFDGVLQEDSKWPSSLYALSAVLMDAESGRILYEKDGNLPRPNASTTKVMTCILAIENGSGDDYVSVSGHAAAQPDVQLGIREGEQYYLEDLLYSLMLKSHNDSAVAIAEHIGGSQEAFAVMMNEKAKEIGCTDTHFVTPNGLDATDKGGVHHTTAADLAKIMRYAIKNKTFLKIVQTREYSFTDISKKRNFSIHNANALMDMMDGVLAGKTGYTANAGYCYVCACEQNGKTLVVSLLGCGWPNHKNYKWSDTKRLLKYGVDNYEYSTYWKNPKLSGISVKNGASEMTPLKKYAELPVYCQVSEKDKKKRILLSKKEQVKCRVTCPKILNAPVKKDQIIGWTAYYLDDEKLAAYPIRAEKNIEKISFSWCAERIFSLFFHGCRDGIIS